MISFLQLPSVRLFLLGLGAFFGLMFFIEREVGVALLTLSVLSVATVLVLGKLGVRQRELYLLFAFVLISHAAFALFVHYTGFQPFGDGGGDFIRYNLSAQEIAERLRGGDFFFEARGGEFVPGTVWLPHYFPLILGFVYALSAPAMVVGQLFVVWVAALAIVALYFLALEVGASRPWAFFVAFLGSFYPSFVFFTSYAVKDGLVVLLALLSLLVLVKILKRFSWKRYALLFLLALPLVNLRSEIYDIFALTFLVSWFAFAKIDVRRRVILGIVLFSLYGLAPLITTDFGYYDYKTYQEELNIKKAVLLKENLYLPVAPVPAQPSTEKPLLPVENIAPPREEPAQEAEPERRGARGSTVEHLKVGTDNPVSFIWNQARAFAFVVAGPFPWQFSLPRHAATLAETLPWLFLLPFILKGIWRKFREDKRTPALALALFAFGVFLVVALFINNFGITMRIRMPGVLALLPFLPLAFRSPYPPFLGAFLSRLPRRVRERFALADWGGQAIHQVMAELERRGVRVSSLRALDMFAGEGVMQTAGYADKVGRLEAWEIDEQLATNLKKNVPVAHVRVADSFDEMCKPEHQGQYDLLVVDNHSMCYGPNEKYCEHFEVFPGALALLKPHEGIIVFNVNREPPGVVATKTHQERKAAFYGINRNEQTHLDLGFLRDFYAKLFEKEGYQARFFFSFPRSGTHRNSYLHSFVFSLERR